MLLFLCFREYLLVVKHWVVVRVLVLDHRGFEIIRYRLIPIVHCGLSLLHCVYYHVIAPRHVQKLDLGKRAVDVGLHVGAGDFGEKFGVPILGRGHWYFLDDHGGTTMDYQVQHCLGGIGAAAVLGIEMKQEVACHHSANRCVGEDVEGIRPSLGRWWGRTGA